MKQVCQSQSDYYTLFKCHNTEEYYWIDFYKGNVPVSALCSDDRHYYQACGGDNVEQGCRNDFLHGGAKF